jgi:thiamine-monophosphate kinase
MEREFIAWLRQRLGTDARLLVGPGDDAAVLAPGSRPELVVTTDMLMDGVDFVLGEVDPRRIGRKALAVNLSDLAAMAAVPHSVVISVALPHACGFALGQELFEGLLPLAMEFNTAIAGGDTNSWDGTLVINITAFGTPTARGPLLRSGAHPGDAIVVTGQFGGSILGKHFDFTPRVREALLLHERYELHAGMDVSDGLSLDLSRMCEASRCGAELLLEQIPIADAAHTLAASRAGTNSQSALDHALGDGEDFELLLAVPAAEAERMCLAQPLNGVPLTVIGRFIAEPGLLGIDAAGRRTPLTPRGYEHKLQ